jgi:folate-dependent phosphoribosylglycinamide formyltransferase PurN
MASHDMTRDLGRPIRVIVFGGPYLHPAAVEFVARVEAHDQIDLLAVLCEGPGIGLRPRLANLWRRRGLMAIAVVATELSSTLYQALRHPVASRAHRRHAQRALAKAVSVPDIHAADVLERVRTWSPELGLVYGAPILKPELFQIPRFGTLGIHHGRVPDYRGKKTTFWEMYHDEAVAGVTIQRINPGIDTGDIAKSGVVPIGRKGYWRVERETEALGFDLFIEAILDVKRGTATYSPQSEASFGARKFRQPTSADVLRFAFRRLKRALVPRSTASSGQGSRNETQVGR